MNSCVKSKKLRGLKVKKISSTSPFYISGLKKGDLVLSINGQPIEDELDFHFFSADSSFEMEIIRREECKNLFITRAEGSFSEIEFFENPINRCRNRCIFCFIDQMPRGLRRGLYIKDEDFKHSFLNGNYVTLSGAQQSDLEKIAQIGLSPLYISVHVTDPEIRSQMLGNKKAPEILKQLRFLQKNGIAVHTQIVVCPGYNDKKVLIKTIQDLFDLSESLLSIAVVPVGLTNFRKFPLQPVTREIAREICSVVTQISEQHYQKDGKRRLFLADEFFVKAGLALPPAKYYEEYPQIGNGVGLLRQLLEEWKLVKKKIKTNPALFDVKIKRNLIITSQSAYSFIAGIVQDFHKVKSSSSGIFDVIPVVNKYFGEMVTVAGLLTAKDVIRSIKEKMRTCDYGMVIVPRVMFNYAGFTLDGYSEKRLSQSVGVPVKVVGDLDDLFIENRRGKRVRKG